ncbi:hypothetical protein WICPIJ_005326 [Wickerhamomyces pijperi]|uniref:Uncharacterized protein n=1 Tax=Wickerhamomyces pijperi TaxID=599730 RepID=A0A9P8Q4B1_WICPI|nr:hypothetical protein WICPIJ_005326 [Wickerhamomyces pijperi]
MNNSGNTEEEMDSAQSMRQAVSRSATIQRFIQGPSPNNDVYNRERNQSVVDYQDYFDNYHDNHSSGNARYNNNINNAQDSTGSCLTEPKNPQSGLNFRTALESQPSGNHSTAHSTPTMALHPKNFLFEDKLAIVTDKNIRRDSKEFFFSHDGIEQDQDLDDVERTIRDIAKQSQPLSHIRVESRSNSMDEVVNRYYNSEDDKINDESSPEDHEINQEIKSKTVAQYGKNYESYPMDIEYQKEKYEELYDAQGARCDTSAVETVFKVEGQSKKPSIWSKIFRMPENKTLVVVIWAMIFILIGQAVISSLPVFTCTEATGLCVPQLTIQLVDKSPAAKAAILTVREALKVLSYLAIDFGDSTNDIDLITNRLDSYYQSKVIDTFNVNTIYQLNFLGYCRISALDSELFCMRSYGFDLIQVFVRDAGVQLAALTNTNIDIMGDSFAIAYELVITGFNELVSHSEGSEGSPDYVKYAILLQKFSKGLGFMSVLSFVINLTLLLQVVTILSLYLSRNRLASYRAAVRHFKKWLFIGMNILEFLNIVVGFLICSLTLEFFFKINDIGSTVGIAVVNTGPGYVLLWLSFFFQFITFAICVYLTNEYRKGVL